ncbi:anthranilate synthase family protein [Streptomonospora litoralis]|uniref:anthranilate synthase n=1 Tax=Streptomonospora litoralis TaxID=2498135 RepID=A0A4P6Q4E3_9ACTN|nr:anthranilate synthase family protein [Streptomonospora litoralis]QBI55453.1 Anthranilate synthase component 1, pyocyanine specific [Streptomonospora litoralis]
MQTDDLFERILAGTGLPEGVALVHRPETGDPDLIDVVAGPVHQCERLADLSLPDPGTELGAGASEEPGSHGAGRHRLFALLPYRQITERGYAAPDDSTPLAAITVREQQQVPLARVLRRLPDAPIAVRDVGFDTTDQQYAALVRRLIDEEIGHGDGANFVLKRTYIADITDYTPQTALALFSRLLRRESGAYWTFLARVPGRTLIGASPERHISLRGGKAVMNPISGTYRYPPQGPDVDSLLHFLQDSKETDELYMVLDEELKMMSRISAAGGRVIGPFLKQMARLAHTEYYIEGDSSSDPRRILHETLYAPTVTGSPLESACRVIQRYEPQGRAYYSGAAALIGHDAAGRAELDSAILIRTADIDDTGRARIGAGATVVRHSDPESEAAETRTKVAGIYNALTASPARALADDVRVRAALQSRNTHIADYWLGRRSAVDGGPGLRGMDALVVDAEDTFTAMMADQLSSLGLAVDVRRFDEDPALEERDLVVMGPGPGDPLHTGDPKVARLRALTARLLEERRPFLSVCLSHQVLCGLAGLPLARREEPNQGMQRKIDLFGTPERVGFYNAFSARWHADEAVVPGVGTAEVCRDPVTGEVHALRGPGFASAQFHAESVLTENGPAILARLIDNALQH